MISGRFLDGRSSAAIPAELRIDANGMVRLSGIPQSRYLPLAEIVISDRIGNIPRRVTFADGAVFETADNDAIDTALANLEQHGFLHKVSLWERRWPVAIGSLAAIAVISWLFIQFGVPAMARIAANQLPESVDFAIGSQSLQILDKTMLAPSTLDERRKREIRVRFNSIVESAPDDHSYALAFRSGKHVGANAFALPSGIVIITDELIELAQTDEEIVAVLAHEVGHVRHRHALRMLLQSAGVGALSLALLGDIGSASALAAAMPTILVQAKHSREFETEADDFAYAWLDAQGISREHFVSILQRLESKYGAGEDGAVSWLSTHPSAAERARK